MTKRISKDEEQNIQRLELILSKELEQTEYDIVMAVSMALSGVRHDLHLQDIAQLVLDLYIEERDWQTIGFAVLSATIESSLQ